jgi:hypothetical protein
VNGEDEEGVGGGGGKEQEQEQERSDQNDFILATTENQCDTEYRNPL